MKKLAICFICIFMLLSCACTNENNAESPTSDFQYELSPDSNHIIITKYIGNDKNVVIPSKIDNLTVTSLNGDTEGVFENSHIETVVIPKTVRVIGNRTFKNCADLSSVDIQETSELEIILSEAFENCSKLKTINLENAKSLTTIERRAFGYCSSIEQIRFPDNLETIGFEAFISCESLKSINVPPKVNLMSNDGLRFTLLPQLEKITFDDGWTSINGYMYFVITSHVDIYIPQSVTSIGTLTINNQGTVNLHFEGDCPQLLEGDRFDGNVTIYYNTNTSGWDTTPLKNIHTLIPN